MNKVSYYLVVFVGVLTFLQFIPHAFMGFSAMLEHIQKGEINGEAVQGMQMIWIYSSIMMLLSSIWMFFLAKPILEGKHVARVQVLYISIGLIAFGLGCSYIAQQFLNHMVFFTIEGVLLLLAVTLFYKKEKNEQ
jgi:cell division protein FtsW (lipid II flippase)